MLYCQISNQSCGKAVFLRGENVLLQFGILGILILFNAFFAASEVAIISLSQASTQILTKRKTRRAAALKALLDDSGRFLATVQIGVTFAGFLASAFAAEAFSDRITTWLESLGLTVLSHERMDTIVVIVITVLLSYVSLVFGELVPKKLGIVYAEVFSYNAALPINGLARLSTPFVKLLDSSVNLVLRLTGCRNTREPAVTEDEIRAMVSLGTETGAVKRAEKEVIENVFAFTDKPVSSIMTHRISIEGINIADSPESIHQQLLNCGRSRLVIYRRSLDDISGYILLREYFSHYCRTGKYPSLESVIRPVLLVPGSAHAETVFSTMRLEQRALAVVLDEFGGTNGIVTFSDFIEDLLGAVHEELDVPQKSPMVESCGKNCWRVDPMIQLNELKQETSLDPFPGHYGTLGGVLFNRLKRIPGQGEVLELPDCGLMLKFEKVDGLRIREVRISRR